MVENLKGLPKISLFLGYGGVLPFLGLAIAGLVGYKSESFLDISIEIWMALYAAVILSFLGAIHWGVVIALSEKLNEKESNVLLIYGVIPSLLAWFSFLMNLQNTLFFLALLILATYVCDYLLLFKKLEIAVSQDFAKLRLHLTIIVSLLLFITAMNI